MPTRTWSTWEAKAKFSELLRHVRRGNRALITWHGQVVAEVRPVEEPTSLDARLADLEAAGVLAPAEDPAASLEPAVQRPGALARFLEERD